MVMIGAVLLCVNVYINIKNTLTVKISYNYSIILLYECIVRII